MKKVLLVLFLILFSKQALATNEAFILGCKSFEEENFPAAINYFRSSLADKGSILPDYSNFYLAKSYYKNNELRSAEASAAAALAYNNKFLNADASILIAKCQLDLGENKKAEEILSQFLKNDPTGRLSDQLMFLLAEANIREKKPKEAFKLLSRLDLYFPLSPWLTPTKAKILELKKKYGFTSPLILAKELYGRGKTFWDNNDYTGAAAMFSQLAKKYPKSKYIKSALYMTGLAELETSNFDLAINTLEQNIREKGPHWQNSYYYLGRAYGRSGRYDKGVNALHYFISLYPNSPLADNAYYYIGYYNEIEKDFNSAVIAYRNLLDKYPESALSDTAISRIGRIYYQQGDQATARTYFAQAAKYPIGLDTPMCVFWWAKLTENKNDAASLYAYLIKNFDYTYYSYRSDEILRSAGFASPLKKEAFGSFSQIDQSSLPKRPQLLLDAGLIEYAKYETGLEPGESYQTMLGLLLNRQGEYNSPIYFAEKKVKGALLSGEGSKLPKDIWKIAYPRGFWNNVKQEAESYRLDPYLVLALIREESRFNPRARSSSYARGLMQIISPTAKILCRQLGLKFSTSNLYTPSINIKMGTYYLESLIRRFNGRVELALAGYNGGPGRVTRWVNDRYNGKTGEVDLDDFIINIPIKETRDYVVKVMGSYYQYKRIYD